MNFHLCSVWRSRCQQHSDTLHSSSAAAAAAPASPDIFIVNTWPAYIYTNLCGIYIRILENQFCRFTCPARAFQLYKAQLLQTVDRNHIILYKL